MTIGKKIRDLRKNRKLTQGQLSYKLKLHKNQISLWETGRFEPSIPHCIMLADSFNVTLDELCCRGDER